MSKPLSEKALLAVHKKEALKVLKGFGVTLSDKEKEELMALTSISAVDARKRTLIRQECDLTCFGL